MKKFIYTIIFLLTSFLFVLCLTEYVFSFYYTQKSGDKYYHTSVSENVIIFNYGHRVKKINYCFTNKEKCNDYLEYDTDISKRIIKVKIDYPDSSEEQRICINIVTNNNNVVNCSQKAFIVDSLKPMITPVYNEVIVKNEEEDAEKLFKVSSNTGIKKFNCFYKNDTIECEALGNNGLKAVYDQKIYIDEQNVLEGKKVLFAGDSITNASNKKNYDGWAGRIGLGNYMKWTNSGKNGATIAKSDIHITSQIIDHKDDEYDYLILQGGINDMKKKKELGKITDSFDVEDFDDKTYAGGLEELFYYAKEYNPKSKIGFIITYQTPNSDWGDMVTNREEQIELTRQICDKWKIPYLDLYDGLVYENGKNISYSEILKVDEGEYFRDKNKKQVHLSNDGYDIISKYIEIWMKTL